MHLLSGDSVADMAASLENARNDENIVGLQRLDSLHLGEHGEGVVVEAAASAGADERDPTADIGGGNSVEQFPCKGELAAARVEGYEIGSDGVEGGEAVDGEVRVELLAEVQRSIVSVEFDEFGIGFGF